MKEFEYLSYHTEYGCTGTINKRMGVEACFSRVFSRVGNDSDITYTVILYPGTEFGAKNRRCNMCLFSPKEVKNHLKQLTSIFPFDFTIKRGVINRYSGKWKCYEVKIHLHDVPAAFHKYVLTWLRYTYEFPYNVILKDTYRLKKNPIFKFTSIANLFNVVSNCYPYYVGEGHSILESHIKVPLKKKDLRERLKEVDRLNSLYKYLDRDNKERIPDNLENFRYTDEAYWSEELYQEREPFYIKMYNTFKDKK